MMNTRLTQSAGVHHLWRTILWGALALLLLIPALAMQVSSQVNWTTSDFAVMALLLAALGLGVEAAARLFRAWPGRLAASSAVLLAVLAIWAELAVGVFGTPFAGS